MSNYITNAELLALSIDLATNKVPTKYTRKDANEALRVEIQKEYGLDIEDLKHMSRRGFRRHKNDIFELIEVTLDARIEDAVQNSEWFADLVEYRNLALGDTNIFKVPSNEYFKISMIANGTQNLRRQRLTEAEDFPIKPHTYGVKIYEELSRFLAGRIDWNQMIDMVAQSFAVYVDQMIANAFTGFFDAQDTLAPYRINTSGAVPTEQEILTLAEHIRAEIPGSDVKIYGTRLALNQLDVKDKSDTDNRNKNLTGFYGTVAGIEAVAISQYHNNGTTEFGLPNNVIYILPETAEKMVKVVNEGESWVNETLPEQRADQQLEYIIENKFGVAVVPSSVYGKIEFTA